MPIIFIRDIHSKDLSIGNDDQEQIKLSKDVNHITKGEKPIQQISFMKNLRFLSDMRQEVLNNFKSNVFILEKSIIQRISEPTPEQLVFYTPRQTRKQGRIHSTKYRRLNEMKFS